MYSKTLFVFLVVYILLDFSNGHNNQVSFRKDYTYIEAVESFYKFHTTEKNWRDAKRECDLEGASLFYPENRDEANAVISFWTMYQNNTLPDDTWVFVGISDIITEGVYETIGGKSISEVYNNWKLNQPDNSGDEDCLHLNQGGNFNDITCDAKYSFICKKTLPSLERNCSCNNQQSNVDGHNNQVSFRKDYTYIEAVESFYKIYTTKKNWRDAKRHCDQEGASLFYPENGDEANAVISFWTLYENNTLPDDTWVFVGISDIITEGVYETIDGKSISEVYNNWKLNQPDNSGDEDCLHLNQGGNFNDITCDAKYSFICKKTLPSLERNCSCNNQQSNLDGHNNQVSFRKDYTYIEAVESFYKIYTTKKNWRDAKRHCDQEGASLFYPENGDEANAVISFWTLYQNNTLPDDTWVFVGISDIITEGVYETIDGKSISEVYNNWKLNQPDNSGDEDCLHLNQGGNFNDITCDAKYSFICKTTLPSLERNCSCNNQQSNLDGHNNQVSFRKDYTYIEAVESFYKIYTSKKNWRDAKRHCDQEGASLFYPENGDEANAVISFWTLYENNTLPDDTWVFVGISDIITEGVYETIDGKSISEVYNNWKLNQPDNSGDEDCLHLNQGGNFNDITCDAKYSFICKKTLPSLERNCSCNNQQSNLDGHNNQVSFRKDYTYIEAVESFYKIYTTKKNWRDAKRHCDQEGASLFYPENGDEANAVISFWTLYQNNTLPDDTWVFVGISDIITEGVYETIDGKSISEVYNNWKLNQPDNSGDEDCLHLNQGGNFNDITCDAKYSFICKTTLPSLERNCSCNNQQSNLDGHNNQVSFRKDYTYIEAVESFYKIYTTKKNWRDAKRHCDQEGASLFYPENGDEANAVISFWTLYQNNTLPDDTWVFVGISDIITEGVYETIDGKSISEVYNNWKLNQPDNSGDEDCLHLNQGGNFNDITCDAKYSFICKKTLPSLERNCSCNNQQSNLDGHNNQVSFRKDYTYIEAVESFYKIYTIKKNWRDAKRHCDQEGASLFYPENGDEANAVISFWTLYQNNTLPDDTWVFVGISDIITEGVYETIDGKSISEVYNNWKLNQPDNSGDEDCLHLNQGGNFNDITCDAKYSFICKKTLLSLERNCSCNNQQSNLDGQRDKMFFRKDYTYIESEESFYKVHTTTQSFADAKRMCALEGASLFYAENEDEANAVISFFNRTQPIIPWVFVGLSDITVEGFFETVDQRPITELYSRWQKNQPDNSGGNEDCVHMDLLGTINDYLCNPKSYFICKKSLQSLEWNYNCNMPNLDYTFNKNTGKCYKLHTTPLNWAEAYAVCRIEYTSLAVTSNRMEADYLANLTKSTPKPSINEHYQRGIYHLGFHNRFNEGWQTVRGTPMNVDADVWFDNQRPDRNHYEECGSMFFNGRLINTDCNTKSMFICEHEVDRSNEF